MALPLQAFHSIYEVAARWGCMPADVAGWAATGLLTIVAGIRPVMCSKVVCSGLVEVPMAEMLTLFRRFGPSDDSCTVHRIRPLGGTDWMHVTEPEEGIPLRSVDLMLPADEVRRFEGEQDVLRNRLSSIGAPARYDWDGMYVWLLQRVHEQGMPESQAALIGEIQGWFGQHSQDGEVPEDSTIRKRLAPLWRSMRAA